MSNKHLKQMSADELLQCLQEDMNMLLDGDWVPDLDSVEAHMDVAEELHERAVRYEHWLKSKAQDDNS